MTDIPPAPAAERTLRDCLAATSRVIFSSGYPGDRRQLAALLGTSGQHGDAIATPRAAHQPAPERSATNATSVLNDLAFLDG